MSNEKKELKVTDKRMFTPEGELREEYRFLSEKSTSAPAAAEPAPAPAPAPQAPPAAEPHGRERDPRRAPEPPPAAPGDDFSTLPPELDGPSFFDLVTMLADPIAVYLGDARLPDGQSASPR